MFNPISDIKRYNYMLKKIKWIPHLWEGTRHRVCSVLLVEWNIRFRHKIIPTLKILTFIFDKKFFFLLDSFYHFYIHVCNFHIVCYVRHVTECLTNLRYRLFSSKKIRHLIPFEKHIRRTNFSISTIILFLWYKNGIIYITAVLRKVTDTVYYLLKKSIVKFTFWKFLEKFIGSN